MLSAKISYGDLRYLDDFPEIDIEEIGRQIGEGREHKVFDYNGKKVLKIPKGKRVHAERMKRELDEVEKTFPDNIPETLVIGTKRHGGYCIVQERVEGETIKPQKKPGDDSALNEVIGRNRVLLRKNGASLEFFGWEGIKGCFKRLMYGGGKIEMTNLARKISGEVVILDFSLLNVGEGLIFAGERKTDLVVFAINRGLTYSYFGIDII